MLHIFTISIIRQNINLCNFHENSYLYDISVIPSSQLDNILYYIVIIVFISSYTGRSEIHVTKKVAKFIGDIYICVVIFIIIYIYNIISRSCCTYILIYINLYVGLASNSVSF